MPSAAGGRDYAKAVADAVAKSKFSSSAGRVVKAVKAAAALPAKPSMAASWPALVKPVQTPAVPQVQPLSSYIPSTPDQNVASFESELNK